MKPYYPLTNDDFHQKRMERERLEIDLSKKIEDLFKDSSVLEPLKNMFQPAFSSFVNPPPDYQHRAVLDGYLDGVCQQNDTLNIWGDYNQHPSLRGLSNVIMDHRADWTVSHCSDLIRLWGEIVEKPPPSLSSLWQIGQLKAQSRDPVEFSKSDKTGHGGYRARATTPDGRPHPTPPHIASMLRHAGSRGATRCRLMPHDTSKKIDEMYGLPEAMAISGTTTDSIFFIDHMQGSLDIPGSPGLAPVLHLLPIATMVSRYHHTVLECALALTIPPAEKLDYYIGFYSTLMPHGIAESGGGVSAKLRKQLRIFEDKAKDMHVFAWTCKGVRHGVQFTKDALEGCRPLFSVKDKMMAWRSMSPRLTCSQAVNLWKRCCPAQVPMPRELIADAKSIGHVAF